MKFRLRRQAAPAAQAPAPSPSLTQEEVFDLVHRKMAELVGSTGTWVVSRRSGSGIDPIFHDMLARSIAHEISTAIHLESVRHGVVGGIAPITGEIPTVAAALAAPVPSEIAPKLAEPIALSWSPAPITVWADGSSASPAAASPAAAAAPSGDDDATEAAAVTDERISA